MIVARISKVTGVNGTYIQRIALTASHRYRSYSIPKRTGGTRNIDHPSRQLKFLQRWLVDNIFSHLPVHDVAYAYRKGLSIRDHAAIHLRRKYLLRIDFNNFFPSIRGEDIRRLLKMNKSLLPFRVTNEDLLLISLLVCKDDKLTIGAPSSPSISNAVMYDFDRQVFSFCRQAHVTYSRYADDLYFSTNRANVLRPLLTKITTYLESMSSPRLNINDAKTEFASRKRKCVVTGLTLTSDRKISVGREKKRALRTMIFRFRQGTLGIESQKYLKGYVAFISAVEPSLLEALATKFGPDTLNRITTST